MPSTILVPLDGSPLAERALPYAAALVSPTGGRLILVRAVPPPARPVSAEPYLALDAARAYLEGLAARLAGRGIAAEVAVPCEDAVEGILTEARHHGADLIAMATHGRGGLGRWHYGSVAEGVLTRTPTPTFLVRAWLPESGVARLGEHPRILVPLDGSRAAEEALPVAVALAGERAGTLTLLRAVVRPDLVLAPDALLAPLLREELATEQAAAEGYLRDLADRFARAGTTVATVVRVGRPGVEMAAEVIEAFGRESGAALVVMTSHRRAGLERLLLGSVADATIRHGTLPVILVRPAVVATTQALAGGAR